MKKNNLFRASTIILLLTVSISTAIAQGGSAEKPTATIPSKKNTAPPRRTSRTTGTSRANSTKTVRSNAVETAFWNSIKDSTDPETFRAYLKKYPNGQFVELAQNKINDLVAAEVNYWNSIKNSTHSDDFKAYLNKYPNGQFVELARNRINNLEAALSTNATTIGGSRVRYRWDSRLYRSQDGGQTWNVISPSLVRASSPSAVISAVVVDPKDSNTIYVGSSDGLIHVTHDLGSRWYDLANHLCVQTCRIDALIIPEIKPENLYVVANSTTGIGEYEIFRTTNSGGTWEKIYYQWSAPILSLQLDPNRPGVLILQTSRGKYQSDDWGNTWKQL